MPTELIQRVHRWLAERTERAASKGAPSETAPHHDAVAEALADRLCQWARTMEARRGREEPWPSKHSGEITHPMCSTTPHGFIRQYLYAALRADPDGIDESDAIAVAVIARDLWSARFCVAVSEEILRVGWDVLVAQVRTSIWIGARFKEKGMEPGARRKFSQSVRGRLSAPLEFYAAHRAEIDLAVQIASAAAKAPAAEPTTQPPSEE